MRTLIYGGGGGGARAWWSGWTALHCHQHVQRACSQQRLIQCAACLPALGENKALPKTLELANHRLQARRDDLLPQAH